MERSVSPTLFSVNVSSQESIPRSEYVLKTALELGFKEDWLQAAIVGQPELVIAPCREAGSTDERWSYWARELQTPAGRIDILLVSESGRVAIVETKLSFNPERRRNVLAQLLDYATSLPEVDFANLPDPPKTKSGEPCSAREEIEQHIRDGDFLLILAADQIDPRALKLSRALLGEHLTMSWELAHVELSIYERQSAGEPRYLMVPHLRGVLVPEERQVVRVVVEGSEKAKVIMERTTSGGGGDTRRKWSETQFVEELERVPLDRSLKEFGAALLRLPQEFPTVQVIWGTGKTGSATVKRNGNGLIEFYLDGLVRFRKECFALALGEAVGREYMNSLQALFPREMDMSYPAVWRAQDLLGKLPDLLSALRTALEAADK